MDFAKWKSLSMAERQRLWQGYTDIERVRLIHDFNLKEGSRAGDQLKSMPPEGLVFAWGLSIPVDKVGLWSVIKPEQQLEMWAAMKPEDHAIWWRTHSPGMRPNAVRLSPAQRELWRMLSDEQKQELFAKLNHTAQQLIRSVLKYE